MRLEALGVSQRVAQYQPPFCIGIKNFYGLSTHTGHHVTGLDGASVRHVFAGGNQAHYIDIRLQLGQRTESAKHTGSATHVELHFVHFRRWLNGDSTGVKGNAFADEHYRRYSFGSPVIAHDNKTQRFLRALGYRYHRAHAELGHFFGAENLNLDSW